MAALPMEEGRGVRENMLNKWIYGLSTAHHVCDDDDMEKFYGIKIYSIYEHVELRDARIKIKKDEDGNKFTLWLRQYSPFIISDNLISLSRKLVADDSVNCYKSREISEKSLDKLLTDNVTFG